MEANFMQNLEAMSLYCYCFLRQLGQHSLDAFSNNIISTTKEKNLLSGALK
jgi:hypothetical protein